MKTPQSKNSLTLVVSLESSFLLNWKQNRLWAAGCVGCDLVHGVRTPNEGISKRNLKIWPDVADKIRLGRT